MIENLKYKLLYSFIVCFRKFMEVLFFTYEIIRHPIKNISIWLVGLLAPLIYGNLYIEIKGKDMFLMFSINNYIYIEFFRETDD